MGPSSIVLNQRFKLLTSTVEQAPFGPQGPKFKPQPCPYKEIKIFINLTYPI